MFKFLKFMWEQYKKQEKLKKIDEKINTMVKDMKSMSNKEFVKKYGKPSKVFAELQWERIKVKKGITK